MTYWLLLKELGEYYLDVAAQVPLIVYSTCRITDTGTDVPQGG